MGEKQTKVAYVDTHLHFWAFMPLKETEESMILIQTAYFNLLSFCFIGLITHSFQAAVGVHEPLVENHFP